MYRLLILLITLSFFSSASTPTITLSLTDDERAWLAIHKTVTFGADSKYAPLEMLNADGQRTGLSSDYLSVIEAQTGLKLIEASKSSWSETYNSLEAGEIDMVTMIKQTDERSKLFNFTTPYLNLESAIITSKLVQDVSNLEDLHGRSVAVVEGYFWHELLETNHPEITIVQVKSLAKGLESIAFGVADAMLATFATATHYIQEHNISNLHVAGFAPYKTEYSMAIRKDWPELASIISKVFERMSTEQHHDIKNTWVDLEWQSKFVRKESLYRVYGITGALVIACLGLLGFVHLLRSQVQKRTQEISNVNAKLERIVFERTEALSEANKQLKILSQKDALTGISNRRHFNEYVGYLLDNMRTPSPVTVMLVDIDHFKAYNDNYGHQLGDQCIIEVARYLERYTQREGEMVARFGGEEFILLLNRTDESQAQALAEKIIRNFNAMNIPHAHSSVADHVTVSVGIASSDGAPKERSDIHDLIQRADNALYASKDNGRNQFTQG